MRMGNSKATLAAIDVFELTEHLARTLASDAAGGALDGERRSPLCAPI
jgi:hypothetical protein